METHVGFAAVQPRNGTVTIPAAIRRKFGLDKPGAQVEIVLRDGEIALVPHVAVPADQAWFWTEAWQAKEHEVDEERAAGLGTTFDSGEEFLDYLDHVVADDA